MTTSDWAKVVSTEGDPAFKPEKEEAEKPADTTAETETPKESPAETKPEQQKPSTEGDNTQPEDTLPFHKHPRWKEREDRHKRELEDLRSHYDSELSSIKEQFATIGKSEEPATIPTWFSRVYGQDELGQQAWKEYLSYQNAERDRMKAEVIRESKQEAQDAQKKQAEQVKYWENWVDQSLERLQDEGLEFDRNELMKVALDYMPSDSDGNIDFKKAYDIMSKLKAVSPDTQKAAARKDIAAQVTTEKASPETKPKDYMTPEELRKVDWRSISRQ